MAHIYWEAENYPQVMAILKASTGSFFSFGILGLLLKI